MHFLMTNMSLENENGGQIEMKYAYVGSVVNLFYRLSAYKEEGVDMAIAHAKNMSILTKALGYVPLSTPLMFCGVYDDVKDRDLLINVGIDLMKRCHTFIFDSRLLPISNGLNGEYELAKSIKSENSTFKIIDVSNLTDEDRGQIHSFIRENNFGSEELNHILDVVKSISNY